VYFEYICWKFAGRLLDRVNTPLMCSTHTRTHSCESPRGTCLLCSHNVR